MYSTYLSLFIVSSLIIDFRSVLSWLHAEMSRSQSAECGWHTRTQQVRKQLDHLTPL